MLSPLLREHWRHGYGTGVLRAYYVVCFMRGITVGVVGTSSLFIAQKSGLPQNVLIAARGVGLTIGPCILGQVIGKVARAGESQCGFALGLAAKMLCEVIIPITTQSYVLCLCFFAIGLSMNYLDTSASLLVEMVHGDKCAVPLLLYCATYGIGAMLAPFFTICFPDSAWTCLAVIDFAVAAAVAGKRFGRGKPRHWRERARLRNESQEPEKRDAGASKAEVQKPRVPPRVFRAGLAVIFMHQAAETAISSWSFTFATTTLQLPARTAAFFPSVFYFSFTATRLVIIPISAHLLPSTIAHYGVVMILFGTMLLNLLTEHFTACLSMGADPESMDLTVYGMLFSLVLFGAGTCPMYAMVLASMRQHGEMSGQEHGWFNTVKAAGMTTGMWVPGLIDLPRADFAWALCMFFIINANVRDFPWWHKLQHIVGNSLADKV